MRARSKLGMEPKRGPLTHEEFEQSAAWIASQQLPSGEIPWQRGSKSDPWDMVHAAMGLAVAGRHAESTAAYRFLSRTQNDDGSWPGEWRGEAVSNATRETNHAAYVATGVWHQFCAKPDADLLAELWPMVSKAMDFVVRHQLPCGGIAWALDPDGSAIELIEDPACAERVQGRGVVIVCRDLARSVAWYERVLGLTVTARESGATATGASFGAGSEARWDAAVLELPQRPAHYALRLEQWHAPALAERPRAVANQLGPFRVAFLVDDAQAWHAELARRGVACTAPPAWLDMGPEIPLDGLWALFFFDPDGACVEMIQV